MYINHVHVDIAMLMNNHVNAAKLLATVIDVSSNLLSKTKMYKISNPCLL